MDMDLHNCQLCPRKCGIDRTTAHGFCGMGAELSAARAMLHRWEEPSISGTRGSGAIFFSGCPLRCVFCQNHDLSHEGYGAEITPRRLADIMLELEAAGAHNVNLVSPTQYLPKVIEALDLVRHRLSIPVVYNTGGYERKEAIEALNGYVDIYLPDVKFYSSDLSARYAKAPDYFERAIEALAVMLGQVGPCVFDGEGILTRGVILRHLVLPGCRRDSMDVLRAVKERMDISTLKLSLMSQYTPDFAPEEEKNLRRRLTTFEYESVLSEASRLGYDGYRQDFASSDKKYTPDFRLQGILGTTEEL